MITLRVRYGFGPGLKRASASILADDGRVFVCSMFHDTTFQIHEGSNLIVRACKTKTDSGGGIVVVTDAGELGRIFPGVFWTIGGRLVIGGKTYRMPNVLQPRIEALTLRFSRAGLLGLMPPSMEVGDDRNLLAGIAILGYLTARKCFIEG